jgi:hypothetical protein
MRKPLWRKNWPKGLFNFFPTIIHFSSPIFHYSMGYLAATTTALGEVKA